MTSTSTPGSMLMEVCLKKKQLNLVTKETTKLNFDFNLQFV